MRHQTASATNKRLPSSDPVGVLIAALDYYDATKNQAVQRDAVTLDKLKDALETLMRATEGYQSGDAVGSGITPKGQPVFDAAVQWGKMARALFGPGSPGSFEMLYYDHQLFDVISAVGLRYPPAVAANLAKATSFTSPLG
jgi:hypothetical protein